MAAGKTGEVIIWGGKGCAIKVGWAEEYNPNTLQSQVRITSCEFLSGTYYGTWYFDGNISVNGQAVIYMSSNPYTHMSSSYGNWNAVTAVNAGTNPPWYSGWIDHNPDGSLTVPISINLSVWRGGSEYQKDTISGTQYVQLTTIPVPKTLTFNAATHSWVSVKKNGTPLASGDTVYYGDVLNITFGADAGYEVSATLIDDRYLPFINGVSIQSGATHIVVGNVAVATTATALGLVYIDNGSQFEAAQIFIDNGSDWEQYMPYIDNGTGFELYT